MMGNGKHDSKHCTQEECLVNDNCHTIFLTIESYKYVEKTTLRVTLCPYICLKITNLPRMPQTRQPQGMRTSPHYLPL